MAKRHFRSAMAGLAMLMPDDVTRQDIDRLRHEIQRAEFWADLRRKYVGVEVEWQQVQRKWQEKD